MESPRAELFVCRHLCQECQQGWEHDIGKGLPLCRYKRLATCSPCLKEVAREFLPKFDPVASPLEDTLWERPEI